ncbi:MAG: hypothetical protein J6M39_03485 [Lachnospiraceae bacterium]|nr:hypothetical protein [Lachnospiraceae bacterium]
MRKSTRIVKRIFALLLVVLMSINTLGAVVSDNDGSAFITKAEFDSLKNNFQAQIDQYNTSLDSKIDGAIASYLTGINIKKKRQIEPRVSNYADMVWKRKPDMYGDLVTWTSASNRTEETNKWVIPPFDIIRTSRQNKVTWLFNGGRYALQHAYSLRGNWHYDQTDISFAEVADSNGYKRPVRCYMIFCNYNDDMGKITHIPGAHMVRSLGTIIERRATNYVTENPEIWDGHTWTENQWASQLPQAPMLNTASGHNNWLHDQGTTGNQFINVLIQVCKSNSRTGYMRWYCQRNVNEVNLLFGGIDDLLSLSTEYGGTITDPNNGHVTPGAFTINSSGLHNFSIDPNNYTAQDNDLHNLMLGDPVDLTANIYRQDNSTIQGGDRFYKYKDELSTFFQINTDFSYLTCHGDMAWTLDSTSAVDYSSTYPKLVKLRLPYAERYDFNNIAHPQFRNNDVPVSIGEGLELVPELTEKGEITIEFDYSVDIPIGTLPADGTGIKVDLKKSNFLTNTNDYVRGLRNDETTAIEMRDAFFDTTDRKAKIVIDEDDVSIGDNIYIRIAPKSTAAGLRAHMSNLKVTFETQSS